MKFVYFGYDFAINAILKLLDEKHELMGIFTFPCDNLFTFNTQLHTLAEQKNIPITTEKPSQTTIDQFTAQGCEAFLSIGYLYKIPDIDEHKAYGINIHPSLLPKGRGIMPLPTVLMHKPEAAGITAHKLTTEIDAGDILTQRPLIIHHDETIETLSSRIAMHTPAMVSTIFKNIKDMWQNATPQNPDQASTFPAPDDAMRTIDWNRSIQDIKQQHRAFGRFGILFKVNEEIWAGYSLDAWEEKHDFTPGTMAHLTEKELIIAAKNGFICMKEAEKLQAMN